MTRRKVSGSTFSWVQRPRRGECVQGEGWRKLFRFTKVKLVGMRRDQLTSSTLSDAQRSRYFRINVTWRVTKNAELLANLLYAIFECEDTGKIKRLERKKNVTLSCHRSWTKSHWYQYQLISICWKFVNEDSEEKSWNCISDVRGSICLRTITIPIVRGNSC